MKKFLELDVGNSFCKWRLVQGREIIARDQILTKDIERTEILNFEGVANLTCAGREWLKSLNAFASVVDEQLNGVCICSVASETCNRALIQIVKDFWCREPEFFKAELQTAGLKNSYQDPSKMGADRWLVSLAAVSTYPNQNLYVVDCGSAINIEILSSDSVHQGGYIVPGVTMMQSALLKGTAKVSKTLTEVSIEPGKETGANVANGSLLAAVSIIEKLQREAVEKDGLILITGGDARYLKEYLDMKAIKYLPDLVLDGFKFWRMSLNKEC